MRFIIFAMCFLSFSTFVVGQRMSKADSIATANKIAEWSKNSRLTNYKWYSETASQGIIIQNSYPKGGGYQDSNGKHFGYGVSFTRLINETASSLELTISFPTAILSLPESYLKLFIPPDTMSLDKVVLYDYGATGLKSFLDTDINSPTMLQRTISPKDEFFFYVGTLSDNAYGVERTELVLKGQDLFYIIKGIDPGLDSALIPCGHIVFKK
jgi:hypothetical protein